MSIEDQDFCEKCKADRVYPPRRIGTYPDLRVGLWNCAELCDIHAIEIKGMLDRRLQAEAIHGRNAAASKEPLSPAIIEMRRRAAAAVIAAAEGVDPIRVDTEDETVDEMEVLSRMTSAERMKVMRARKGLSPSLG